MEYSQSNFSPVLANEEPAIGTIQNSNQKSTAQDLQKPWDTQKQNDHSFEADMDVMNKSSYAVDGIEDLLKSSIEIGIEN